MLCTWSLVLFCWDVVGLYYFVQWVIGVVVVVSGNELLEGICHIFVFWGFMDVVYVSEFWVGFELFLLFVIVVVWLEFFFFVWCLFYLEFRFCCGFACCCCVWLELWFGLDCLLLLLSWNFSFGLVLLVGVFWLEFWWCCWGNCWVVNCCFVEMLLDCIMLCTWSLVLFCWGVVDCIISCNVSLVVLL